jgi:hypothetical protein
MNGNGEEVIIPLSRTKMVIMILVSYGFIGVIFWLGSLPEHHNIFDLIIMVIGVIF